MEYANFFRLIVEMEICRRRMQDKNIFLFKIPSTSGGDNDVPQDFAALWSIRALMYFTFIPSFRNVIGV